MGSVAFSDPRIQLIVAVVEVELSSRSILQKRTEKWWPWSKSVEGYVLSTQQILQD